MLMKWWVWLILAAGLAAAAAGGYWLASRDKAEAPKRGYSAPETVAEAGSIELLCAASKRRQVEKEWQGAPDLADKLRNVPSEICPEWIRFHFRPYGLSDHLIDLRASLDHQKDVASGNASTAYGLLVCIHWITIGLGLLTTVFTGLASRLSLSGSGTQQSLRSPSVMPVLALITAALGTAAGATAAFYDFRGDSARHWATRTSISELASELDSILMAKVAERSVKKDAGTFPDIQADIKRLEQRRASILRASSDQWVGKVASGK